MSVDKRISLLRPISSGDSTSHSGPPTQHPLYINRELSWLEFNRRVLHEGEDERTPLLERLKFLSIVSSNLDEFFMKRVGALKLAKRLEPEESKLSLDGLSPLEELQAIRPVVEQMLKAQHECFAKSIAPAFHEQGIQLCSWKDLSRSEKEWAGEYFAAKVFPVLTPLSVDKGHPFPFISHLSSSLGVLLKSRRNKGSQGEQFFARVKLPGVLKHWIRLPGQQWRFLSFESLLQEYVDTLFPGMKIIGQMMFRVTRSVDVEREDEEAEDLLEFVEEELRLRRFAEVVRVEQSGKPNAEILQILKQELEIEDSDIYHLPGNVEFQRLKPIYDINFDEEKYPIWVPITPSAFSGQPDTVFDEIRARDLLVHHPYHSFQATVEKFLWSAVEDPHVLAIKMTVYRTGDESSLIPLLVRAAQLGKQVVCLVELTARFDEQRNIYWAQELEKAGAHVVYGILGLKTHAKVTLVVREESGNTGDDEAELRSYAHIGTGNYHAQTAGLYSDLGLFTARPEITQDIVEMFHFLTGRSEEPKFKNALVAPTNMKAKFLSLIQREAENKRKGKPARIVAKMNSLEHPEICAALSEASKAGVQIDLLIRGVCVLRPGVPGFSENIRVFSLVGRLLEHSRLFFFQNGAAKIVDGELFLGSADWMIRNLERRIELIVPVVQADVKKRCWEFLEGQLGDQRQCWELQTDATYVQRKPPEGGGLRLSSQELMMERLLSEHKAELGV